MWNLVVNSNPIGAMLVADLTEQQEAARRRRGSSSQSARRLPCPLRGGNLVRARSRTNEEVGVATKKQKARAAAAGSPLSDKQKATKKTSKVKKTSRGK